MVKNDNILALASPSGVGAISLIRISGPQSISIVDNIFDGIEKIKLADQIYPNVEESALLNNGFVKDPRLSVYWDRMDKSSFSPIN